jgi:single-strand DNA-binding protein
MAQGLNRVQLLGNLGADPELRFTQGGTPVLNMRMATTESYLDKDKVRKERTDWHNIVVWGKRGEALAEILRKGSSCFVEGSLRTSSYEDRDGNKRYKTEVIVSNVILTGGRRDDAGEADGAEAGGGYAPRGGGGYAPRGGGGRSAAGRAASAPNAAPAPEAPMDDEGGGYEEYGGGDDTPF